MIATPSSVAARALHARIVSIIGVILLPLLIASGFIWATSGNGARLHQSEAAIVNLDQGSTLAGKPIHLGQTYALELKNQQGPNFTWRYGVTMADAQAGLASGRYSAAVVIPPGFSRVLTGTAGGSAADQATLVVERSPLSGVSDQMVFSQLSAAATHSLASDVTKDYLDELFVSSSELGESLTATRTMADEARQGAEQVKASAQAAQQASGRLEQAATDSAALAGRAVEANTVAQRTTTAVQQATQKVATTITTTTTGSDAQTRAVDELATSADGVSQAATRAAGSARTAAGQAKTAGSQGAATQASADAVAKAAAANSKAAADYRAKVGAAAKAQQDLAGELEKQGAALDSYVNGTQDAAATVQQTVSELKGLAAPDAGVAPRSLPMPQTRADATAPDAPAEQGVVRAADVETGTPLTAAQLDEQAEALAQQAAAMESSRPDPAVIDGYEQAATALSQQAGDVAASADDLAGANRTVATATTNALGNLRTATKRYEAVIASMDGEHTATVKGTATGTVGSDVTLPEIPPCPRQNNPSYCKQWQKGFERYREQVQQELTSQEVSVDYQDTATVTVTPDARELARARGAARTATLQLTTAAASARANQAGLDQLASDSRAVASAASQFPQQAAAARQQLVDAATAYDEAITQLRTLSARLTELSKYVAGFDERDQASRQQAEQLTQEIATLKNEVSDALSATDFTGSLDELAAEPTDLTEQSAQNVALAQANAVKIAAVGEGSQPAKALASGSAAVETQATNQAAVVEKLQGVLSTLNEGMAQLGTTMTGLTTDAAALERRTTAVSDNAARTAGNVTELNRTLEALQGSTTQAAADARTAGERASQVQQQVTALQQSSGVVRTSTTTVTSQAAEQAGRIDTLSKKVAASAELAPSYTEEDRQRLTDIVTTPIGTEQSNQFRNVGWVSMLMLLSLWAGSMSLHSAFKPVSDRARTSTGHPLRVVAGEMLPAAMISTAQALGLSAVAQLALDMSPGRWLLLAGTMVLAGYTFAAVNHALVAFLRVFGRLVAVGFALVTGATLITQAYPESMDTLRALSPISPALDTVRSVMTGAAGGGTHVSMMLAWLGAGVLFSALAILRAREPEPVRVPTVHAAPAAAAAEPGAAATAPASANGTASSSTTASASGNGRSADTETTGTLPVIRD